MSDASSEIYEGNQIAIIGMAGRFPGASDLDHFWRNLRDGVESIARLSDAQLRAAGVDPADLQHPNYVKAAPILEQIEDFDAAFFGFSPVEAEITDPQQRILLECAWEALEHAGYDPERYPGAIGVYGGSRTNTYVFNIVSDPHLFRSLGVFQISVGNDLASLATRISYKLNLRGPSYAVHTACSTALVAVHLACQSLLIDECQMALAGGGAVNVPNHVGYLHEPGGVLSPDGHCRPFDAAAQGTVFGSGAGMVLLKRLEDALRDGDTIHAVIRGSATNNDGSNKASFTAPSVDGQTEVILDALAEAEVHPETISYVEAHGTGTALGDPIEVRALTKAFRNATNKRQFCAIGSVKSNIGHLDAAAGISSLIKTVLALQHGQIPPSLHYQTPNPRIDFAATPFFVNTALREWPRTSTPRRAGVSSFGFGGTNAHLIVEEAPAPAPSGPARPWQLLPLAARSPAALEQIAQRLAAWLRANPSANLADVAYTLQVGRQAFDHRRVIIARDPADALAVLEGSDPQRVLSDTAAQVGRPVVFMFPGQGAQYPGMAADLYASEPVFRQAIDQCAELLGPHLDHDLRTLLWDASAAPADSRLIDQTQYTQPALFAIEYALALLWQSWGIQPAAMIGHSLGEYVAATLAGVFSLADALALVAARGRLMQGLPSGAMLTVTLPEAELLPLLGPGLALAAINGPQACVVAGPDPAVDELAALLGARGVQHRRLHTSHAFHSPMMEPIVAPFMALVAQTARQNPQLPLVSNLSGSWLMAQEATDPDYWAQHLRQPVYFADGLATLLREPNQLLLEVGPGATLATFARRQAPDAAAVGSLRHPNDQRNDSAVLLAALGRLWLAGVAVDWAAFSAHERRRRLPLPTYPFERQRHWIAASQLAQPAGRAAPPSKKAQIEQWFYTPAWQPTAGVPSASGDSRNQTPRRWLVFADACGLTDALATALAATGQEVLSVRPGPQYAESAADGFTLDPRQPADYDRLVQAVRARAPLPLAVVHAWGVTSAPQPAATAEDFATAQDHGFYSLVFLTQALVRAAPNDAVQIDVLTNHTQQVHDGEPTSPAKATVLGPCRVIPQEQPLLGCRTIDLELPATDMPAHAQLIAVLLDELRTPGSEATLAYRGTQRLTQHFNAAPALEGRAVPLRQGGVYLITGGLGGLGLLLGLHLARRYQASLVLVGRTALPPRDTWASWLHDHDDDDPIRRKLLGIQELEAAGAQVLALEADVADPAQLRAVVEQAQARFGAIHGVLHAAGLTRDADYAPVQRIDRAMCERHFRSKALGLIALEQALADQPLDFWLLFSSLASVLGGLSYVAYAAANLYLDAAARRAQPTGPAWISVAWDSWHQESTAGVLGTTLTALAITPDEGLRAFEHALALGAPQLIVSTSELQPRLDQWVRLQPLRAEQPGQRAALPPRGELERQLVGIWQRVLGRQQIGLHDNFFDLGGDSLSGMQLISELKRELGVQIAPVTLFEAPNISALARLLSPAEPQPDTRLARQEQAPRPTNDHPQIAIIGMAGRFPGAPDVASFWHNLCAGQESITFFSDDELRAAGVAPDLLGDPAYIKARPILADVDLFDAAFFGYSPREAELMDPQHRAFLEVAWQALEQAGYAAEEGRGAVGVFGGASMSSYLLNLYSNSAVISEVDPLQTVIGNAQDSLTTSVSYKLNLRGPSIAVQTFCSTSLVAVHLACQSLARAECSIALAGGSSILLPQQSGYRYHEGSILSPDGHSRPFDARAAGTLFGNGVGVVVLKRLEQALADGDQIYAVVRGSAINNDGAHKAGYTAPSVDGQAAVIMEALDSAGVAADSIGYVEAHGTGTALGDPIEISALTKAYRHTTDRSGFCAIGSVKSNIGHLDRAAGVAALIKATLALQHGQIPPSLHYDAPNPRIDFANSPFFVNTTLRAWPDSDTPRRAGVSALGFGGTNAHVILEQAPARDSSGPARPWQLLPLAARTPVALAQTAQRLAAYLRANPAANLADVAYTLQVGRKAFAQRRVVIAQDVASALAALEGGDPAVVASGVAEAFERPIALALGDLTLPALRQAHALYQHEPVYSQWLARCAALLEAPLDLQTVLASQPPAADHSGQNGQHPAALPAAETIEQTRQVAVFAVEYALAQLWLSWGLRPQLLLGEASGEYVAACLAGVLSLEDALALALTLARAQQDRTGPAHAAFRTRLQQTTLATPQIGCPAALPGMDLRDPHYWLRRLETASDLNQRLGSIDGLPGMLLLHCAADPAPAGSAVLGLLPTGWDGVLQVLGQLWLAGVALDWRGYAAHEQRLRVALPLYPFERQRYWIDYTPAAPARPSGNGPTDWLYTPSWRRAQPLAPRAAAASESRRTLICLDAGGLGAALAQTLRARGQSVATVQAGARFERLDTATYAINPQRREEFVALLAELGAPLDEVIHCWSLDLAPAAAPATSLLALAQALAAQRRASPLPLWVISSQLVEIAGEELIQPERAAILGLCQALAEFPALVCRTIDLGQARTPSVLAAQLLDELDAASGDRMVAYRGKHRWLPTIAPQEHSEHGAAPNADGVYLLTGRLDAPSEQVALSLLQRGRPRLALALPAGLPARASWQRWQHTDATAPGAEDLAELLLRAASLPFDLAASGPLLQRLAAGLGQPAALPHAAELEAAADRLCASYVCSYLSTADIGARAGQRYRIDSLLAQLRIVPKYRQLFAFMLDILADEGVIALEPEYVTVIRPFSAQPDPALLRAELTQRHPESEAGFRALERCVQHYDQVLSGALDPIAVLYPQGNPELMQAIAENQARFSNLPTCWSLLAGLTAELARQTPDRPLRVLEIGAGDGQLTWQIMAALQDLSVSVHVTDIGKSFVIGAERRAAELGHDDMRFGVLDISHDPAAQGLPLFGYDLVLAAEVIHATSDVRASLANAAALLAPGGLLCILEASHAQRWSTMVWGILDGWWQFTDRQLRANSPLLPAASWRSVMTGLGLAHAWQAPAPGQAGDYAVVIAQQPALPADPRYAEWRHALLLREQERVRAALAPLRRLEQAGADLLTVELTTPADAPALVAQVEAQLGPINGVIHGLGAAPAPAPAPLVGLTAGAFGRQLAAQLGGLLELDAALQGRRLDVALALGSMAAYEPPPDMAGLAAAHWVALTLATQSHGGGLRWSCLHWDASGATAAPALELALARRHLPQQIVSQRDLERVSSAWQRVAAAEQAPASGRAALHLRPALPTAYCAPRDEHEQQIAQVWEEVLGIAQIGVHDSFLDLGGDSLMATQLTSRLRDTLQIELPLRVFFENPTVAGVAQATAQLRAEEADRDVQDVLALIQQLSPEQIAAELLRRKQAQANDDPTTLLNMTSDT